MFMTVELHMDVRPFYKRFEIPLIGIEAFNIQKEIHSKSLEASRLFAHNFTKYLSNELILEFNIQKPQVYSGSIATGDKFFSSKQELIDVKKAIPSAFCVEMEGTSVAQVCHENGIPYSIIRTISDRGDEKAEMYFSTFVKNIVSPYSLGIIDHLLPRL
jgi:adenosylhomocysteine nucleosidase